MKAGGSSALRRGDEATTLRFGGFPHAPSAAAGLLVFSATVAPPDAARSGLYAMALDGASGASPRRAPWAVATLRSTNLSCVLAAYNGFDGACLGLYGVSDARGEDALFAIDPREV